MIAIAIQRGRAANPTLKIGICGEHAGDPASLASSPGSAIDYVSCSPYRVPGRRRFRWGASLARRHRPPLDAGKLTWVGGAVLHPAPRLNHPASRQRSVPISRCLPHDNPNPA